MNLLLLNRMLMCKSGNVKLKSISVNYIRVYFFNYKNKLWYYTNTSI